MDPNLILSCGKARVRDLVTNPDDLESVTHFECQMCSAFHAFQILEKFRIPKDNRVICTSIASGSPELCFEMVRNRTRMRTDVKTDAKNMEKHSSSMFICFASMHSSFLTLFTEIGP